MDRIASLTIARIATFSALIVVGTSVARIPLPPPIFEITLAPAFYLAIAALFSKKISFWSTAIGSGIGEAINLVFTPGPLIFIPGIIWARAPEALMVYKFREKPAPWLAIVMILATIYETIAFLIPDTLFYAYGLFSYADTPQGLAAGFGLAFSDVFTLLDIVFVPVAILAIIAVRRVFHIRFFD